jgi:CheY-like chemotaxis protein
MRPMLGVEPPLLRSDHAAHFRLLAEVQPVAGALCSQRCQPMKALRILVVEDNAMVGMMLAEMLEQMGHEVCGLEFTEAAAVSAALSSRPDLMIVDGRLGDGCGVAAVEAIRRVGAVPHLFASGDIARIKSMSPGAVVLQKPFFEADLARAIQSALAAAPVV